MTETGDDHRAAPLDETPAMRSVQLVDGQACWASSPAPQPPTPGSMLVRVRSAAINGTDRRALRESHDARNDRVGIECAGEVVAIGPEVTQFVTGDRVMGLTAPGAQAEFAILSELTTLPIPSTMGWAAAGAFCEVWTTAHDALARQLKVGRGHRILVTGAAGGVGFAAIQLAEKAGAHVVASVRNPGAHSSLRRLVGDGTEIFTPEEALTKGPFTHVLELVGGPGVVAAIDAMAHGGRMAFIGISAGATAEIPLFTVMQKSLTLTGSTLKDRSLEDKGIALRAAGQASLLALGSGEFQMPAQSFEMDSVGAAYSVFNQGGIVGKIVLLA